MVQEGTNELVAGECGLDTTAARHVLLIVGWLLVCFGFVHLAIWLVSGQPWEGSISWRKPALFGISGGMTLISLGILYGQLTRKPWDNWLISTLAVAMSLEVFLIAVQQWRGVESHFNQTTRFDGLVDAGITGLIVVVTLCIIVLSIQAMRCLNAAPDKRAAWIGGLVFLLISCAFGFVIYAYGVYQTSRNLNPGLFGNSGVVKFPHGMAIHAIQLLPGLCWLMTRLEIPIALRTFALRFANVSLACLLCFSVVQTLSGRARGDLTAVSGCILLAAAAFAAPLVLAISRALANNLSSRRLSM